MQLKESAVVAEQLIAQAVAQQQITRGQLTLHADRGSSMRSKPVAFLLADLGVTKTHSRPYTSADNPYSEAQLGEIRWIAAGKPPGSPKGVGQSSSGCRAARPAAPGIRSPRILRTEKP